MSDQENSPETVAQSDIIEFLFGLGDTCGCGCGDRFDLDARVHQAFRAYELANQSTFRHLPPGVGALAVLLQLRVFFRTNEMFRPGCSETVIEFFRRELSLDLGTIQEAIGDDFENRALALRKMAEMDKGGGSSRVEN